MNGIAGHQVAPGENTVGIQREVADRERADAVKNPACYSLNQVTAPR
jgi:hypothetical protein